MMSTKTMSGPMVGDLRQRVEAVFGGEDLAAFLGQQRFGGAPNRLAVVDHEHLEPVQGLLALATHALLLCLLPPARRVNITNPARQRIP